MDKRKKRSFFWATFRAIFKKEVSFLFYSPAVITFAILFPIIESVMLGYVLDVNVRNIKTVVYDLSNTQKSKELLDKFVATNDFEITEIVTSDEQMYKSLVSGRTKVGIKIPVDYSDKLVENTTASVLVLVDGSDARVTTEVVNVANIISLRESINVTFQGLDSSQQNLPVGARINTLYNPATRSADFFLPGLMVFDMPSITILLLALSFAAEIERGNMDQLCMAPISSTGFILGKSLPYGLLCLFVLAGHLLGAHFIYGVKIHGNPITLLILSIPYLITSLGIGITISAFSKTQVDAMNLGVLARVIPTLYLSGYFFPIEGMPEIFQSITKFVPDRYFIEITRGVVLRGAGFEQLWWQTLVLSIMATISFSIAALIYYRKI